MKGRLVEGGAGKGMVNKEVGEDRDDGVKLRGAGGGQARGVQRSELFGLSEDSGVSVEDEVSCPEAHDTHVQAHVPVLEPP